ncbi:MULTISPECIES: hypothetical protein [unclassified Pseudoalteromonas]|jgi:hypothetical protein|uniref:hypothetical protein n=1 Tax=unclassified Pseudoalteromonas TaxID=194690 RepID=UPI0011093DF7|nr:MULTISPECIES: hypothetical protein [unclassified Pseudoalteromonas]MBW4968253.1 hypothetical protein [Pseudoalteromonas sp. CR1]TMN77347.1 hypothetical protein CWB64_17640 [Pseudoalteromonas sp. S410]TMN87315.1 hypothetical protein CWB62_18305 [Pseudoalteromonas sp. S408]TMN95757.1 hypothetical protein CWB61_13575 [Pseudoalteromonas sp. S407]TMN96127.1 hypothetical protein CWB63_16875 [Pseudoalteromonas sp. S409]|tara:strand:- start:659 stop:865 length:207 start_codon:yes stop_codon:yes gene_type:complete
MDFSNLNKKTSDSFHKQRNMLKQLAKGKTLKCEKCNSVLTLDLATSEVGKGAVKCKQGCTDIILELGA